MSDLRIVPVASLEAVTMDMLLAPAGGLDETKELVTSVAIALGTDRRAYDDDELPGIDDNDRRGWWGDTGAEQIWGGWPIGTRRWLLERAKITGAGYRKGSLVARAEAYDTEAMQPFVENGIASRVTVSTERSDIDSVETVVTIYRGPRRDIELRFQSLWDGVNS